MFRSRIAVALTSSLLVVSSYSLRADVRADQAAAQYQDGMLRVEVPLVQRPPHSRAVPIESREPQ